jgi:hypothetical protein
MICSGRAFSMPRLELLWMTTLWSSSLGMTMSGVTGKFLHYEIWVSFTSLWQLKQYTLVAAHELSIWSVTWPLLTKHWKMENFLGTSSSTTAPAILGLTRCWDLVHPWGSSSCLENELDNSSNSFWIGGPCRSPLLPWYLVSNKMNGNNLSWLRLNIRKLPQIRRLCEWLHFSLITLGTDITKHNER